jgi:hypothetical protein
MGFLRKAVFIHPVRALRTGSPQRVKRQLERDLEAGN